MHSPPLAQVQQPLAGCAAEVALVSFEEGAVRCTLGALELATLLGFQGGFLKRCIPAHCSKPGVPAPPACRLCLINPNCNTSLALLPCRRDGARQEPGRARHIPRRAGGPAPAQGRGVRAAGGGAD